MDQPKKMVRHLLMLLVHRLDLTLEASEIRIHSVMNVLISNHM